MNSQPRRSEPKLQIEKINGLDLAAFEWNAALRGKAPTLFISHATGFHGRTLDQVLAHLGERHVISVETRGHGRSENVVIDDWKQLDRDLDGWISRFALEGAIGLGHSAGGLALVGTAARHPNAFERLLLLDPVIKSPDDYDRGGWNVHLEAGEVHPTARRKNEFASPHEMFERFAQREPYKRFTPEALRDYCTHGLLPASEGGGYVLACPPQTEASVYMSSSSHEGIYDLVRRGEVPVMVLRAKAPPPDREMMDFSSSPTWPGLAAEFPHGVDRHLPDHTHFIPMEDPALVARYVETFDPEAG